MNRVPALLCALLPAACSSAVPPAAPVAHPHYTLGTPYAAGGIWRYPRESFDLDSTGLAVVQRRSLNSLTADGEVFDPTVLAAAHPTLQLPAVARVTNLETGRQVLVRINDRGPTDPGRLLAVTPRVAELLEFPASGVARIRLQLLAAESHAAADELPGAPRLAIQTAPRTVVQRIPLSAPAGIQHAATAAPLSPSLETASDEPPAAPMHLPETAATVPPSPGQLWIALSPFHEARYARGQRARVPGLPGEVERLQTQDGTEYRTRLGPFATVSEADAALAQAIQAGISDARIAVE